MSGAMTGMPAYYNEIEPYAAAWLRNLIAAGHLPAGDVDERSIVDVRGDDLRGYGACHFFAGIGGWPHALRLAGVPDDMPIWTGSCPCQPFSVAGAGAGTADERHLWPAFRRLIEECRPATVFGEQVAGKAGRLWLTGVRADLEELGYAVGAADLAAASVGAPHIRQRLYWMAHATEPRDRRDIRTVARTERETEGSESKSWRASIQTEHCGAIGGLAHAHETGQRSVRGGGLPGDRDASHGDDAHRCGQACGLGDADNAGLERRREFAGERAGQCASRTPGAWDHSIPIPCGDGKSRRIERGLSPLVAGVPFLLADGRTVETASRVGVLKAFGNAIVPPLAAEFVRAAMETIDATDS